MHTRKEHAIMPATARRALLPLVAACSALLTTGCAFHAASTTTSQPTLSAGAHFSGSVHGGQQPIAGASLHLYAAGITGYYGSNTDLLHTPVSTDANGNFNITNDYSCSAGQQMYLVALGGNPGSGINAQSAIMAALGDCTNLTPSTFILMNEVTTVATAFALSPFMSGYANLGTSATNVTGLKQAFTSVNKLANFSTGTAGGPALAANAIAPVTTINTLANILASCVNSTGGAAGSNTTCGKLFTYATASGASAPTNTIELALAIAKHPALNVASLIDYDLPISPFGPRLSNVPNDFTLSIVYSGFSAPKSTAIDASGNVWIANSGNNTLTQLSASGAPLGTYSGNGLSSPSSAAVDIYGQVWVLNSGASQVSLFGPSGAPVNTLTTLGPPTAIAFDATATAFIGVSGSSTVQAFDAYFQDLNPYFLSTNVTAPTAIAINPR